MIIFFSSHMWCAAGNVGTSFQSMIHTSIYLLQSLWCLVYNYYAMAQSMFQITSSPSSSRATVLDVPNPSFRRVIYFGSLLQRSSFIYSFIVCSKVCIRYQVISCIFYYSTFMHMFLFANCSCLAIVAHALLISL